MTIKDSTRFLLFLVFAAMFGFAGIAQQGEVTGIVYDIDDNASLPGASVLIKGTTIGTTTDIDGKFTLKVDPNTVLVISYVSYQSEEITVQPGTSVNIALIPDSETLDEVIIIGYGVQKKEDKTGAVSSINSGEFNGGTMTDPIQAMQGKVAGVTITKKGGDPNAGFSVRIRGAASYEASNDPLYVIDGIPGADPTSLSPDDIASYNILKDAASTAIYGSQGSNGVVIITTNRGNTEKGQPGSLVNEVNFNLQASIDNVLKEVDLLDAQQIRDFNANNPGFIDGGASTNWQDEIYRTGFSNSAHLGFSGGNNISYYNAALTYSNWDGVMMGTSKKRNTFRMNIGHGVFDNRLRFTANWVGMFEDNDRENYDGWGKSDIIYQALQRNPTDPVYNESGNYFESQRGFNYQNPVAIINGIENIRKAKSFLGSFKTAFTIIDGLDVNLDLSMLDKSQRFNYFRPSGLWEADLGAGEQRYEEEYQKLLELTAVYVKSFSSLHNINVLGGYSWQENGYSGFFAKGENAQSDYIGSSNLAIYEQVGYGSIGSWKGESTLIGFFARAQYNYNQKYYLSASLRRDGSTKFGANNKWGWFPTAAVSWNMHSEDFLSGASWLDQLKLRASYGVSGNQRIGDYHNILSYYPAGLATNPETGQQVVSFEPSWNANPDLKWEETSEINIGIDFSFWRGRLSGSIDVYKKKTTDLLGAFSVPVPPNLAQTTWGNSGEIENKGLEVFLQAFPVSLPKFSWKTTANFAANRTVITDLGDFYNNDDGSRHEGYLSGPGTVGDAYYVIGMNTGEQIGAFYLPTFADAFTAEGKPIYLSETGGYTDKIGEAQRTIIGYANPKFEFGWSNYLTYNKNWHLDFSFRALVGNKVYNATRSFFDVPGRLQNLNAQPEAIDWYEQGRTSDDVMLADIYVEDASFVRLDYISLSYDFNFKKEHKVFKNLTIYLASNNLFTITGYSGVDPETSISGLNYGIDQYNVYPKTRTFTLGIRGKI